MCLLVCLCVCFLMWFCSAEKQAFKFYWENPQIPQWIDNYKQDNTDMCVRVCVCVSLRCSWTCFMSSECKIITNSCHGSKRERKSKTEVQKVWALQTVGTARKMERQAHRWKRQRMIEKQRLIYFNLEKNKKAENSCYMNNIRKLQDGFI